MGRWTDPLCPLRRHDEKHIRLRKGVVIIRIPYVDWKLIMEDLRTKGYSPYKVSLALKVADCTARNWAKGGEPGYSIGRALLRLHSSICGASLTISRTMDVERTPKAA